jgi:NitT/TauT family transport system substrate-binding protein
MAIPRSTLITGLGAAFAASRFAVPAGAAELKVVHAAGVAVDDMTAALYAQQAGIFAKHGLDVRFQGGASGAAIAAGVAGGSVDVGKSSLTALILAHTHGIPFKLVAPAGLYDSRIPVAGLIVSKDSSVRSARDFNGAPFSVSSLDDMNTLATRRWVDANGGDSSSLKFVELTNSAVPNALEQGRVLGATFVGPILAQSLDSGKFRLLANSYDAIAKRFIISAWFSVPNYLDRNADTGHRFAAALREAAAYTNVHKQQTVDLLANASKVEPRVVATMPRSGSALSLDPALIQPVIDACVQYKLIPNAFPARDMIWT